MVAVRFGSIILRPYFFVKDNESTGCRPASLSYPLRFPHESGCPDILQPIVFPP